MVTELARLSHETDQPKNRKKSEGFLSSTRTDQTLQLEPERLHLSAVFTETPSAVLWLRRQFFSKIYTLHVIQAYK